MVVQSLLMVMSSFFYTQSPCWDHSVSLYLMVCYLSHKMNQCWCCYECYSSPHLSVLALLPVQLPLPQQHLVFSSLIPSQHSFLLHPSLPPLHLQLHSLSSSSYSDSLPLQSSTLCHMFAGEYVSFSDSGKQMPLSVSLEVG